MTSQAPGFSLTDRLQDAGATFDVAPQLAYRYYGCWYPRGLRDRQHSRRLSESPRLVHRGVQPAPAEQECSVCGLDRDLVERA